MNICENIKVIIESSGYCEPMKTEMLAWLEYAEEFGIQNDELVESNNKLIAKINELEDKIENLNKGLPAWQKIRI